jgi:hypothetical protein
MPLKILLFLKNNFIKNKKSLQQMPKGWKCLGSPYWICLEFVI